MAQRPRRQQQPFRFWLPWTTPTPRPTPQRPRAPTPQQDPSGEAPSSSSQPSTQPQLPIPPKSPPSSQDVRRAPQTQPPSPPQASPQLQRSTGRRVSQSSPSSSPSPSPSPSPSRRSPRAEAADRRETLQPSPSRASPSRAVHDHPLQEVAKSNDTQPTHGKDSEAQQEMQERSVLSPPSPSTERSGSEVEPASRPQPEQQIPTQPIEPTEQLQRSTGLRVSQSSPSPSPSPSPSRRSPRAEAADRRATPQPSPSRASPSRAAPDHPLQEVAKSNDTKPTQEMQERSVLSPPSPSHTSTPTELSGSEVQPASRSQPDQQIPTQPIESTEKLEPIPTTIADPLQNYVSAEPMPTTPTQSPKSETLSAEKKQTFQEPKLADASLPSLQLKHHLVTTQATVLNEKSEQEMQPKETVESDRETKEFNEQKQHPQIGVSEELKKRIEPDLSITVSDLKSSTSTGEPKESKEQPKGKRVSKITISTIPRDRERDRANFQKEIKDGLSELVQKLSIGQWGQSAGSGEGVSIITLAGQNKGATMVVSNEGITKQFKKHENDGNNPLAASVNNNVMSINNSLLNESSCNEGNPGVHLVLSSKPTEPISAKGRTEVPLKAQPVASDASTPQKLTYEPRVRRRCLRGLLMEPSEDDIEDPQKPRRHGCRVSCDEKKKGKKDNDEGASRI